MQLRTHPKMSWEGFSNWPPAWAGSYGRGDIFPVEEEGVLTGVEMAEADNRFARFARHLDSNDGASWGYLVGGALLRREEVIPRLLKVLKGCIGWPISRIGDLDVDL
jgi:hypothetical protein